MKYTPGHTHRFFIIATLCILTFAGSVFGAACSNNINLDSGTADETQDSSQTQTSEKSSATDSGLQILADPSMKKMLTEMQGLYEAEHNKAHFEKIRYAGITEIFEESSSSLDADLILSNSIADMDMISHMSSYDRSTRMHILRTRLIIVAQKNAYEKGAVRVKTDEDLKNFILSIFDSGAKVALGAPSSVISGKYANQVLYMCGLYSNTVGVDGEYDDKITGKILLCQTTKSIVESVANGKAKIGFILASDLPSYKTVEKVCNTTGTSHKKINYEFVLRYKSDNEKAAKSFVYFMLTDDDAVSVLKYFGFKTFITSSTRKKLG